MLIRTATIDDIIGITDIYNHAILNSTATFDTEPKTLQQQKHWFESHNKNYPVVVAVDSSKNIAGWASLSRWSDRCAYDATAELSVYVRHTQRGKGIGKALMQEIIIQGKQGGVHTILSRIVDGNAVSISIHQAFGFFEIGTMKEVGFKFGKRLDVLMMQKILC